MMWEAAARKIMAQGGRMLMGRELENLAMICARSVADRGDQHGRRARELYRAPCRKLGAGRELVAKLIPAAVVAHARALRYRDFITVALMMKKPEVFADNWIYIHDPSVKVGRVQNFGSWSPEMAPDGMSCLGLEYFCFEGDGLWTATDAELIALGKREATKIGLVAAEDVVDGCVVRQPKAYPVYDDDYREHMAMIRRDLEPTIRPCIWSAAMACTNTTIRIMP